MVRGSDLPVRDEGEQRFRITIAIALHEDPDRQCHHRARPGPAGRHREDRVVDSRSVRSDKLRRQCRGLLIGRAQYFFQRTAHVHSR